MKMKKGIVAGIGALMLLGGGVYGIQSVSAAGNPQAVETKATEGHAGKRLEVLSQFKDQIHQVNQLKEERLALKQQIVDKKDGLLDLLIAAKNSGNRADIKQAKEVKKQFNTLNGEMKALLTKGKEERKGLKEALKKGEGSEQFNQLIATNKQINETLKEKLAKLVQMTEIFK